MRNFVARLCLPAENGPYFVQLRVRPVDHNKTPFTPAQFWPAFEVAVNAALARLRASSSSSSSSASRSTQWPTVLRLATVLPGGAEGGRTDEHVAVLQVLALTFSPDSNPNPNLTPMPFA